MAEAIKVGILNDMSAGPPGPSDIQHWLQLAVDEAKASGRLDRDICFVNSWGLGLPEGSAASVEHAFRELVEQDVLLIVGPAIGDNALVATPLADQHRVPTINWAGSERARSEYMFHLQVGSHEDESIVLARHMAEQGIESVAVVYDQSPIGRRYHQFLQSEAAIVGLDIVRSLPVSPLTDSFEAELDALLMADAQALVYLGLGHSVLPLTRGVKARDWSVPRFMTTAGMRGYHPQFSQAVDGWFYLDMFSDANKTLQALQRRLGFPAAKRTAAAKGYDLGRLVVEGISRAGELTRQGVLEGLEQVKWLPAMEGRNGTLLGFGRHDRGALHGQYLVLRQWLDGESVEFVARPFN